MHSKLLKLLSRILLTLLSRLRIQWKRRFDGVMNHERQQYANVSQVL